MTVHCCQLGGCRGLGGGPPQRAGHRQCPHPRGEEAGEEGRVRQGELTNHSTAAGHVTPCSPLIGCQADPYVLITLGGTKTQTKTVANSQSPVWDFVARLGVDSPATADTLLLQVRI